jgi:predicted amidohydrolase
LGRVTESRAPLIVAAGQAPCAALEIPANVAAAAALVRQAADQGAGLLVLPELFLTGYELAAIRARPDLYAVGEGDARLDPLASACEETGTAAVVGAPSRDGQELYISAVVLGGNGKTIGWYHKQHATASERSAGFSPGRAGLAVTLDGWRLGIAICADVSHPEHARAAALDGCHAYLVSAMFDPDDGGMERRATLLPALSAANGIYAVAANHCGPSGPYRGGGRSAVWGPDGRVLAEAGPGGPDLAVTSICAAPSRPCWAAPP